MKKGLKQLRKAREEERAAKELQEEMLENVEKAQERVLQLAENLWKELDEYMYSWEQEFGRPNHLSTKIWQLIRSNHTKSENLENDFTEILDRTRVLGWNETTESIRVWAGKRRMKVGRAGLGALHADL